MQTFKVILIIFSSLILLGCNDMSTKSVTTDSEKSTTSQSSDKSELVAPDTEDLTKYGIANNPNNVLGGLKVGDKAPEFKMQDQDGNEQSLSAILKDGPVLLVFLRAEWCSFCVKHLKEFQDNIESISQEGQAKVIAISPQKQSYMKEFHAENQFSFPILYDESHAVMKDYKVLFHVTDKYNAYIEKVKGERIEVFNGDKEPVMPVPATYLIGQDGNIQYVHYDPDYKKRSDLEEVIAQF